MTSLRWFEMNEALQALLGQPDPKIRCNWSFFPNFFQMQFDVIYTLARAYSHKKTVLLQKSMSHYQLEIESFLRREGLNIVFDRSEIPKEGLLCAVFFQDHEITGTKNNQQELLKYLSQQRVFTLLHHHHVSAFTEIPQSDLPYVQSSFQLGRSGFTDGPCLMNLGGRFRMDLLLTPYLLPQEALFESSISVLRKMKELSAPKTPMSSEPPLPSQIAGWKVLAELSGRYVFLHHEQVQSGAILQKGALLDAELFTTVSAFSYDACPMAPLWSKWWDSAPKAEVCRGLMRVPREILNEVQNTLEPITQSMLKNQQWQGPSQ